MLTRYFFLSLLFALMTGCASWNESDQDAATVAVTPLPPGHIIPGQGIETSIDTGPAHMPPQLPEANAQGNQPSLYFGSGDFVSVQGRSAPALSDTKAAGDVTLNFEQADLRDVIQTVLGELLKASYILDPAVNGKVTLQTGSPLRRQDLLPTLETLLAMNGAALVQEKDVYRILPLTKAIQGQQVAQLADAKSPLPSGYSLQVVPLNYIGAHEMADILQPLTPKGGIVRVDGARNLLVLAGTGGEMSGLLETIRLFDVDWIKGLSVGFFPLKHAKTSVVIKELQAIVGSVENNPLQGMFRIVPVEEANGILVVTPQKQYLRTAAEWIPRLDRVESEETGTSRRLYVYRVQNGDAQDLADLLQQLYSSSGTTTQTQMSKVAPGKTVETLSSSTQSDGVTTTATGTRAANLNLSGSTSEYSQGEVRVVADIKHNSLVITATPDEYATISNALERLDVRQLQVMVEATIIEVALEDELQYGLQWAFNTNINGGRYDGQGVLSSTSAADITNILPGFNFSVLRSVNDVRMVLNALASDSLVRVLSSPSVMVLDNETASIQVGDQVPIVTRQSQSTSTSDSQLINNISYRDTGVLLEVTPRVNPSGLVTLDISQEVSDVSSNNTSSVDSPTISTRKITSTVAVQNGEALILGGLIKDQDTSGSSGLPFLSNLPLIGWLFGQESKFNRRTELVVVLVPSVVSSPTDNRQVVESFRRRLEGLKGSF
ncbi:MAG: type II secretion system secretin GspD [Candidatus Thiodiazotropha sp.]